MTVGEVATMMDITSTQIISACMTLGIMVTMNQRLDSETLSVVADEFGYKLEFIKTDLEEDKDEFEVKEDATKAEIKRAFGKSLKGKKMNKKILSEFIELVA